MRVRWGKVFWFAGVTFAASWGLSAAMYALGVRLQQPLAGALFLPYMFMPALSAVFVQRAIYREPVARPLGISFRLNRWFLAAWLIPPALALGAFGVSLLFPSMHYSPSMEGIISRLPGAVTPEQLEQMRRQVAQITPAGILALVILGGMIAGITINAVAAFGEELGWRGLLLRELEPLGFWRSALLIGLLWGLWHAPLIWQGYNYPQHPRIGVAMMTAFTLLFTPLIIYVTLRARSVIAAAVMHGTLNGVVGAAYLFVAGGTDLTQGLLGVAGFIVLAVANIILVLYDRSSDDPLMRRRLSPSVDKLPLS